MVLLLLSPSLGWNFYICAMCWVDANSSFHSSGIIILKKNSILQPNCTIDESKMYLFWTEMSPAPDNWQILNITCKLSLGMIRNRFYLCPPFVAEFVYFAWNTIKAMFARNIQGDPKLPSPLPPQAKWCVLSSINSNLRAFFPNSTFVLKWSENIFILSIYHHVLHHKKRTKHDQK